MSYGYVGSEPSQVTKNTGVFNVNDAADLNAQKNFSGALQLIETIEVTNSDAQFTNLKVNEYDIHFLTFQNVLLTTDNQSIVLKVDVGGGYSSANYFLSQQIIGGTLTEIKSNNYGHYWLTISQGGAVNEERGNGYVYIYNLKNGEYPFFTNEAAYSNNTSSCRNNIAAGGWSGSTAEVVGLQILQDAVTSNFQEGKFSLYGIKS